MKKKLLFIGLCLSMGMSLTLVACGGSSKANGLTSPNDVYGLGAVSSVKLLGSNVTTKAIRTLSAVRGNTYEEEKTSNKEDDSEQVVKEQAEKFNEYFTALDSFLGEDIVKTTVEENTDEKYPYETKMMISGKDINGEEEIYTMYYTETLLEENLEEEDEVEKEYQLVGVMVVEEVDYYLEGERTEEVDLEESETELKIRAYADISDKTSYIQMEQEHSIEDNETETEYVYSIYEDGQLIEQTAVEFELEKKNNKVETEYALEFRSGSSKGYYIVEREEKENIAKLKVRYNIDGKVGVFHIREIVDEEGNKKYEYSYNDGSKQLFE